MRIIVLFFVFISFSISAQDEQDPFDKYGPPTTTFTTLKDALKDPNNAFKVKIEYQPFEPKLLDRKSVV